MQKMKMMKTMMKKLLSNLKISIKTKFKNINWFQFYIRFTIIFIYAVVLATFALLLTHSKESNKNPTIPSVKVYTLTPVPTITFTPIPSSTPTLEPKIVHLNDPIRYPTSLDELYQFVENREPGYVFPGCSNDFAKPYLDWSMVKELITYMEDDQGRALFIIDAKEFSKVIEKGGGKFTDKGFLIVSEDDLFFGLITFQFDYGFRVCSVNNDGYPTLWSDGVQPFLYWLQNFVISEDQFLNNG